MEPRNAHVSSSASSASRERQRQSGAMRTASAHQSLKYVSATAVDARRGSSTKRRYAQRVTSANSRKTTSLGTGYYSEKYPTRTRGQNRRSAITRSSASKSPDYVGNLAYPAARNRKMEISRNVTRKCHFPAQSDEFFPSDMKKGPATATEARPVRIVPDSRAERIACTAAGVVGAVLGLGFSYVMSALKIGGFW